MEIVVEDGIEYEVRYDDDTTYLYTIAANKYASTVFKASHKDGFISYWKNGKRHRLNGPAIINTDGSKKFFIEGKEIEATTTEEFIRLVKLQSFQ